MDIKKISERFKLKQAQDSIKSKHEKRKHFYQTLFDYITSSTERSPDDFFAWYLKQLDRRMEKYPDWGKFYYRITKTKNDTSMRYFLTKCYQAKSRGVKFTTILKSWLPPEEYRILKSNKSSDISESLKILINMCDDKISGNEIITNQIKSHAFMLVASIAFHFILYKALYPSFVNLDLMENTKSIWDLPLLEFNYSLYQILVNDYIYIITFIFMIILGLKWSINNWCKRGLYLREQVFDYIFPYNLSKINQQYQLILIVYNFMKAGESLNKALKQAHSGANEYIKYQIEKILKNSATSAHKSFNIFYLGEPGNIIEEKAENMQMVDALEEALPHIKKERDNRTRLAITIASWMVFKPLIFGGLAFFVAPVVMHMIGIVTSIKSQL